MNFYEIFSNDVSFVENCDLKLKYSWDFGKHNFSYKELAENQPSTYYIDYYRNSGKAQYIFYNLENDKYIFTSFMFNGKIHSLILDKKTNKLSFFEKFKEGPWFYAHAFFDKGCYAALEMENLKRFVTPDILDSENQIIYNKLNAERQPRYC